MESYIQCSEKSGGGQKTCFVKEDSSKWPGKKKSDGNTTIVKSVKGFWKQEMNNLSYMSMTGIKAFTRLQQDRDEENFSDYENTESTGDITWEVAY